MWTNDGLGQWSMYSSLVPHELSMYSSLVLHELTHLFSDKMDDTLRFLNTLRPRQNWRHFPEDILKSFSLYENAWISIKISLKFVPKGPINNNPALVQIMGWRRPGDKPLSETMLPSLLAYICFTWPQWVKRKYLHFDWNFTEACS